MKRFLLWFRQKSAVLARERTAAVLYMDRLDCPADTMKYLKRDMKRVIEKYLNIENADVFIRMDIKREVKQGVKDVKTIQIERL